MWLRTTLLWPMVRRLILVLFPLIFDLFIQLLEQKVSVLPGSRNACLYNFISFCALNIHRKDWKRAVAAPRPCMSTSGDGCATHWCFLCVHVTFLNVENAGVFLKTNFARCVCYSFCSNVQCTDTQSKLLSPLESSFFLFAPFSSVVSSHPTRALVYNSNRRHNLRL